MARVTLRLPEDLHRRLRTASERTRASLNQFIVTAVSEALAREAATGQAENPLVEESRRVRNALGDLVIQLDPSQVPPQLRPPKDLPDADTLRQSVPVLQPSLSATIIAERADRI